MSPSFFSPFLGRGSSFGSIFCLLLTSLLCAGCATKSRDESPLIDGNSGYQVQDKRNRQIVQNAASASLLNDGLLYRLGAGDIIELSVFQVPELNTKVRVDGRGEIVLPMLGTIAVQGMPLSELEALLVKRLKADYLQSPQVSLFIDEYRSQQITVMGAVNDPNVYSVRQPRSIFEMLSLAGGLSKSAGDVIRVETVQNDPQSGHSKPASLLLSVDKLLQGGYDLSSLRLKGGDSIMVPEAGVVFVEGAVKKPGSYQMQGETTVLKAIAMAGGIPWEGKQSKVEVIREISGDPIAIDVNLHKVRNQQGDDIVLRNGDIVVISYSTTRRAVSGFFRAAGQILGYSLN